MKYVQKMFLSWLLILALTACNSSNTENNQQQMDNKTENAKLEKEGQAAKEEMTQMADSLSEKFKENQPKGYLEADTYSELSKEFNILALAVDKSTLITLNDNKMIDEKTKKLKETLQTISMEKAIKAKQKLTSSKIIYEVVFVKDLHYAIEQIDLNSFDNNLSLFISQATDSSNEEVYEEAKSAIHLIQSSELHFTSKLQNNLIKYGKYFKEDELQVLTSAIQNADSSIKTQVKILQRFTPVYLNDGSSERELIDSATADFENAENSLEELENMLGVEYREE